MLRLVFATHKLLFGRSTAILQKKWIFTVNQIPPPDPTSFRPTRLLEKTILQEMFRQIFIYDLPDEDSQTSSKSYLCPLIKIRAK